MTEFKNLYLGSKIKVLHNKIENQFTQQTRKIAVDLTGTQYITLVYLNKHRDRDVLQKEFEDEFQLSHPSVRGIIKRLDKQGYVQVFPYKENKRLTQVRITESGQKLIKNTTDSPLAEVNTIENQLVTGFTDQEVHQLNLFLDRLITNLNK